MAAFGLDLPCTGSSRTHLWLFAPALSLPLSLSLSLSPLREAEGTCVYQAGEEGRWPLCLLTLSRVASEEGVTTTSKIAVQAVGHSLI
ncbi:hypothetical protein U9M48_011798 [Paspalum notatum var. saurae]|uniref:Secreted protein n=1 Tax=Paspalum notatum var. saurae TaxID=547442 RepID=A0AAQ3SWK7_PASNO